MSEPQNASTVPMSEPQNASTVPMSETLHRSKRNLRPTEKYVNYRSDILNQRSHQSISQLNADITNKASERYTGKLIIGKLSELIGMIPINSDKFIGSDKIIGWWFSV